MEAQELLGSFDGRLRQYAARKLTRAGVHLVQVGPASLLGPLGCRLNGAAKWWNLLIANFDGQWRQYAARTKTPQRSPSGACGPGWLLASLLWQVLCQ